MCRPAAGPQCEGSEQEGPGPPGPGKPEPSTDGELGRSSRGVPQGPGGSLPGSGPREGGAGREVSSTWGGLVPPRPARWAPQGSLGKASQQELHKQWYDRSPRAASFAECSLRRQGFIC